MLDCLDDLIWKLPFQYNGYTFNKLLGSGSFAHVFHVTRTGTDHSFAAKVIHCTPERKNGYQLIQTEINCLISLLHPNVIKIYDYFKQGNFLFLILELCDKGSMADLLGMGEEFTEKQIIMIMKQLLSSLKYCHSQGVAHRDIKPANILLTSNGLVKLSDFGLGINTKENEKVKMFSGSYIFKAPELLKKVEHDPFKADIWSLGVTFYFIAIGCSPWDRTKEGSRLMIENGLFSFPEGTSETIKSIIRQMLVVSPEKRPTADSLLENECFKETKIKGAKFENRIIDNHFYKKKTLRTAYSRNFSTVHGKPILPLLRPKCCLTVPSNISLNTKTHLFI